MSKIATFEDLFRHELSDIRSAEQQLTKALVKMAKAATNPELKAGFEQHQAETEQQLEMVDQVFELCGIKPERITCEAMKGLVEEAKEAIDEIEKGPLLDCALIVGAQKVEHYEISGYGSLCALAERLGYKDAVKILRQIEEQESATDEKLTMVAKQINVEASGQTGSGSKMAKKAA